MSIINSRIAKFCIDNSENRNYTTYKSRKSGIKGGDKMPKAQPMYERINSYIESTGVSRKLLSINSGIPESKLSLILNGKRRLQVEDFEKICIAISVNPAKFYESA